MQFFLCNSSTMQWHECEIMQTLLTKVSVSLHPDCQSSDMKWRSIVTSSSCWAVGRLFGLMTRTNFKKVWNPSVLKYAQHNWHFIFFLLILHGKWVDDVTVLLVRSQRRNIWRLTWHVHWCLPHPAVPSLTWHVHWCLPHPVPTDSELIKFTLYDRLLNNILCQRL